jgi:hypothetical protein
MAYNNNRFLVTIKNSLFQGSENILLNNFLFILSHLVELSFYFYKHRY